MVRGTLTAEATEVMVNSVGTVEAGTGEEGTVVEGTVVEGTVVAGMVEEGTGIVPGKDRTQWAATTVGNCCCC